MTTAPIDPPEYDHHPRCAGDECICDEEEWADAAEWGDQEADRMREEL